MDDKNYQANIEEKIANVRMTRWSSQVVGDYCWKLRQPTLALTVTARWHLHKRQNSWYGSPAKTNPPLNLKQTARNLTARNLQSKEYGGPKQGI